MVTVADSFSDLDLVVEAFELHPDEQRREHLCQIATAYETAHIQSVLCYKLVVRCVHVHRYRDEGINLKFILKFQKLEIRSI